MRPVLRPETLFVGIDPGTTGAIAGVTQSGHLLFSESFRASDATKGLDFQNALGLYKSNVAPVCKVKVFIEHVHAIPKFGSMGSFSFGSAFGALCMLVTCHGHSLELVRPAVWQKAMGIAKADKDKSRGIATMHFPGIDFSKKKDHNRAEAALIAEYGRRLYATS